MLILQILKSTVFILTFFEFTLFPAFLLNVPVPKDNHTYFRPLNTLYCLREALLTLPPVIWLLKPAWGVTFSSGDPLDFHILKPLDIVLSVWLCYKLDTCIYLIWLEFYKNCLLSYIYKSKIYISSIFIKINCKIIIHFIDLMIINVYVVPKSNLKVACSILTHSIPLSIQLQLLTMNICLKKTTHLLVSLPSPISFSYSLTSSLGSSQINVCTQIFVFQSTSRATQIQVHLFFCHLAFQVLWIPKTDHSFILEITLWLLLLGCSSLCVILERTRGIEVWVATLRETL
jgi:hypothetical protein